MALRRVTAAVMAGVVLLGVGLGVWAFREPPAGGVRPRPSGAPVDLDHALAAADVTRGAELFGRCAACHSIGRESVDLDGPNLYGVVGSRIARRRTTYGYTAALRSAGGVWTVERLDAWLKDPAAFAPGTKMLFPGLPDPQDRADVIAYLRDHGPK